MPKDTGGPYVAAAFFCERVLEEKDGVFSPIRIFDRMNVHVGPLTEDAKVPENIPPMVVPLTLFLLLRSGKARGRSALSFTIELPSGVRHPNPQQQTIHLEGEERGAQVIAQMGLPVVGEGLYWFEVAVDGDFLTKVPLRIRYEPH